MFSLLFVVFLDASFFCASFACHVLVPVHRCKMPVFHLELFVSRCFGPNGFFSLPLFSSAVCFPFFRSHSLFLDDPFCLDLFAFHFFFPVHFWKMTVFHLELFASRFFSVPFILPRCHRFFLDIYLLLMFSSQSIAAR